MKNKENEKVNNIEKKRCPICDKYIHATGLKNHMNQHKLGLIKNKKKGTQTKKSNQKRKNKKRFLSKTRQELLEQYRPKPKPKITLAELNKVQGEIIHLDNLLFNSGILSIEIDGKRYSYKENSIKKEYQLFLDQKKMISGNTIKLKIGNDKIEWTTDLELLLNDLRERYNNSFTKKCNLCYKYVLKESFNEHTLTCQEFEAKWQHKVKEKNRKENLERVKIFPTEDSQSKKSKQVYRREKLADICRSIMEQRTFERHSKLQSIGRFVLKNQKTQKVYLWWLFNDISRSHEYIRDLNNRVVGISVNPNNLKIKEGVAISKNSKLVGDLLTSEKSTTLMKNGTELKLKNRSHYFAGINSQTSNITIRHLITGRKKEKEITWGTLQGLIAESSKIAREFRGQLDDRTLVSLLNDKQLSKPLEELFKDAKPFIRDSIKLRHQDILQSEQESVKRGNIFNNTTLVIDGGPGTGKTTSLIQRIKFLTSPIAIKEYIPNISDERFHKITNTTLKNWIFYSPSELLAKYLKENMIREGLEATNEYVKVWTIQKSNLIKAYNLSNILKEEGSILDQTKIKKITEDFFNFHLGFTREILEQNIEYEFKNLRYKTLYNRIKVRKHELLQTETQLSTIDNQNNFYKELSYYFQNENDDDSIFKFYREIQGVLQEKITQIKNLISDRQTEEFGAVLLKKIKEKEEFNLDKQLDESLKATIKILSENELGHNKKISIAQNILLPTIVKVCEKDFIQGYGEISLFYSQFKFLKSTFGNFFLELLLGAYSQFRSSLFNAESKFSSKKQRTWYEDEFPFFISLANETVITLLKKKIINEDVKQVYIKQYLANSKNIIAVDEASDLNLYDLKCIYSFRDNDISSVTFCGDIMQRMTNDGVNSWNSLNEIIEDSRTFELKTSFRQSPTLLKLARRIYKEVTGTSASYKPYLNPYKGEPNPLLFIDEQLEERINWIVYRVDEVFNSYGKNLPATAVFVPNKEDIKQTCNKLEKNKTTNSYQFLPYSKEVDLSNLKNTIVVFSVDQIKGLEFEVVFFHDLQTLEKTIYNFDILLRYIYVGLSRAAYYFGMTSPNRFQGKLKFLNKELKQNEGWS